MENEHTIEGAQGINRKETDCLVDGVEKNVLLYKKTRYEA